MPAMVLPEFTGISGHRCVRSPLAGHEAVHVSTHQADSGSSVQGEGERCPSPTRERPPWESPIRQDLLSQLQGKVWHPQPEIWKLWVWPV